MKIAAAEYFFIVNDLPRLMQTFSRHRLEPLCRNDHVQAWRCHAANSSAYAFDVVSMRRRLLITGDVGDVLLKDLSAWGHEWLRDARQVDHFASKIATWPADRIKPNTLMTWLGWQFAAASAFRALLWDGVSAHPAPGAA